MTTSHWKNRMQLALEQATSLCLPTPRSLNLAFASLSRVGGPTRLDKVTQSPRLALPPFHRRTFQTQRSDILAESAGRIYAWKPTLRLSNRHNVWSQLSKSARPLATDTVHPFWRVETRTQCLDRCCPAARWEYQDSYGGFMFLSKLAQSPVHTASGF